MPRNGIQLTDEQKELQKQLHALKQTELVILCKNRKRSGYNIKVSGTKKQLVNQLTGSGLESIPRPITLIPLEPEEEQKYEPVEVPQERPGANWHIPKCHFQANVWPPDMIDSVGKDRTYYEWNRHKEFLEDIVGKALHQGINEKMRFTADEVTVKLVCTNGDNKRTTNPKNIKCPTKRAAEQRAKMSHIKYQCDKTADWDNTGVLSWFDTNKALTESVPLKYHVFGSMQKSYYKNAEINKHIEASREAIGDALDEHMKIVRKQHKMSKRQNAKNMSIGAQIKALKRQHRTRCSSFGSCCCTTLSWCNGSGVAIQSPIPFELDIIVRPFELGLLRPARDIGLHR